ncbi:TPA: hypothetical protein ACFK3W_09195 [Neisseria gonorrhoeae]
MDFRPNENPPCKRTESDGYSNASEQKKADIPARPYRYGNHASDSDGGILPVVPCQSNNAGVLPLHLISFSNSSNSASNRRFNCSIAA